MIILFIALVLVNLTAFALFGIDKRRARQGKWRIREATLLGVSACFGALGALLGMYVFRHKTRTRRFRLFVPALLVLQIAAAAVLLIR